MKKRKTEVKNTTSYSSDYREICLLQEVFIAEKLLKLGFGELQKITYSNYKNWCYHLPFLLFSSGFERLIKCLIALTAIDNKGGITNDSIKKTHNIAELLKKVLLIYSKRNYSARSQEIKSDIEFLSNDNYLKKIVSILSKFAIKDRYYYLDIVSTGKIGAQDPRREWNAIETAILYNNENLKRQFLNNNRDNAFEKINRKIVILLEKFARALARMFDKANFSNLGTEASRLVADFLSLSDDDLGTKKYF